MMKGALFSRIGPSVWLIEPDEHGVFLYRFGPEGFEGDTWHPSVDEAKAQAAYVMKAIVGPWNRVPSDIVDIQAYGKALAATPN
jgi:hypothetical protein